MGESGMVTMCLSREPEEALGEVTGTLELCERRWWYGLTSFKKKTKTQIF